MTFLRYCWYAAAWAGEIGRKPIGRTILGESITFYRREDGGAVAIASRCPHRFAPLFYGDLVGDNIRCAYHGLQFSDAGRCVANPHAQGTAVPPLKVRTYKLVEKQQLVWIWMGDGDSEPDDEPIDEYSYLDAPAEYATSSGYLHVNCSYRLVIDNLLDHAHATHLHAGTLGSDAITGAKTDIRKEPTVVHADRWAPAGLPSPLFGQMLGDMAKPVDQWTNSRWEAPSLISIDAGATAIGRPIEEGIRFRVAHIVTPETEKSCHYFWSNARNFRRDDQALSAQIGDALRTIFATEDQWILEGQQAMMMDRDFWDLRPSLLSVDEAVVTARRMLDRMIEAQHSYSTLTVA